MHCRVLQILLAMSLIAAASGTALAQEQVEPLRPLDQTVDDRGGLARSLREVEPGLRVPSGFEQVYHVPDRDDLLMRINGGLYAVFPSSQYRLTPRGPVAIIPNDTVFYIGPPDFDRLPPRAAAPGGGAEPGADAPALPESAVSNEVPVASPAAARREYWDGRVHRPRGSGFELMPDPRTVANDEAYRSHRLRELARHAARRAPGGTHSGV